MSRRAATDTDRLQVILWHFLAHDAVRVLQRLVQGVQFERTGQVGVRQALVRAVLAGERELAIDLFKLSGRRESLVGKQFLNNGPFITSSDQII